MKWGRQRNETAQLMIDAVTVIGMINASIAQVEKAMEDERTASDDLTKAALERKQGR